MTITKTSNDSYRLKLYVPTEARPSLGISGNYYDKRFKTKKEAKEAELQILININTIQKGGALPHQAINGDILFKDFYHNVWWEAYKAGQTTSTNKPPTLPTVNNTETVFRLHILPMFGNYSIKFLNQNKTVVLNLMTAKANEYANFKVIRSYVNSIFDWAEELEYIEMNRLSKTISRIKAVKKQILKENKRDEDLTLDEEELRLWLQTFDEDLKNGLIEFKDYVLFYTTFFLSDRKSESYALQWKHVNFETNQILIENALDRFGNVKATKGGKKTIFNAPLELMILLKKWKKLQKEELKQFGLRQTNNQFIFTYNDRKNNINTVLHIDYLNYRMNSIRRRHPELAPASPHKLRHTGATLARKAGVPIEEISEALTHSDQSTTKTYINTKNTVKQPVGEIVFRNLKKQ